MCASRPTGMTTLFDSNPPCAVLVSRQVVLVLIATAFRLQIRSDSAWQVGKPAALPPALLALSFQAVQL